MKKIEMLIGKLNYKIERHQSMLAIYGKMIEETDNDAMVEKLADNMTEIEIDLIPQLEIEIENLKETLEIFKKYSK